MQDNDLKRFHSGPQHKSEHLPLDDEGRSLDDAKNPVELLEATNQWIEGLRALNEAGIIHRDISNGNLMLPSPDDQPKQASIIDFGLAHWTRETIEGQGETMEGQQDDMLSQDSNRGPKWSPQPHFHGTLPFVAHELLKHCYKDEEHKHALHHDVESIFWVLLHISLERGGSVPLNLALLYGLLNWPDIGVVRDAKLSLLVESYKELVEVGGDFGGLKYFLINFAKHYQSRRRAGQPLDVEQVLGMAKRGLADAIEKAAKLKKAAKIQLKKAAKAKKAKAPKIGTGAGPSTSQKPDSSNRPRINSQGTSDPSKPTPQKRKKNDPSQLPTIDEHQQGDTNQERPPERKKAKTETLDSIIGSPER